MEIMVSLFTLINYIIAEINTINKVNVTVGPPQSIF